MLLLLKELETREREACRAVKRTKFLDKIEIKEDEVPCLSSSKSVRSLKVGLLVMVSDKASREGITSGDSRWRGLDPSLRVVDAHDYCQHEVGSRRGKTWGSSSMSFGLGMDYGEEDGKVVGDVGRRLNLEDGFEILGCKMNTKCSMKCLREVMMFEDEDGVVDWGVCAVGV